MPVSREQYAEAKAIWKASKIGLVKPPLTDEQLSILRGTAYYYRFQESGWIDEHGWPINPEKNEI